MPIFVIFLIGYVILMFVVVVISIIVAIVKGSKNRFGGSTMQPDNFPNVPGFQSDHYYDTYPNNSIHRSGSSAIAQDYTYDSAGITTSDNTSTSTNDTSSSSDNSSSSSSNDSNSSSSSSSSDSSTGGSSSSGGSDW